MPFVKLDCGILNSTIWFERDAREVFITALLMAEPIELRDPAPQINVRDLELTSWAVPPGWYGFVPAAGVGIVNRAGLEREAGLAALEQLGAPEIESRSPEFDGRRLVRIDGGYIVLNYIKYREKDATTAERSRRWRQRQKEQEIQLSDTAQRVSDTSSRVIRHQAEAEAEAEAEVQRSKPTSLCAYAVTSGPRFVTIPIKVEGNVPLESETDSDVEVLTYPTAKGGTWTLSQKQAVEWQRLYPQLDIAHETRKALAWLRANPTRRKTGKGMPRFFVNWFNSPPREYEGRQLPAAKLPERFIREWRLMCRHSPECSSAEEHAARIKSDKPKLAMPPYRGKVQIEAKGAAKLPGGFTKGTQG